MSKKGKKLVSRYSRVNVVVSKALRDRESCGDGESFDARMKAMMRALFSIVDYHFHGSDFSVRVCLDTDFANEEDF